MKRNSLNWSKPCVAAALLAALCISGCKITSDDVADELQTSSQMLKIENGVLVSCNQEAEYIEIPNGVTKIGDNAFSNCHKLKSVTIPVSVTSISKSAFNGCGSLTINYSGTKTQWKKLGMSLPAGIYVFCSDGNFETGGNPDLNPEQKTCTLYFYPHAPEGTPEEETLEPKTVTVNTGSYYALPQEPIFSVEGYYFLGWTESPDYASYTYKSGEEIWIPTELNIPDTYTLYAVWGDTTYINGLYIYKNIVVGYIKDELPADVVIPDGVTAIGYRAFSPLSGKDPCEIKSVTIPGTVQRIEMEAFSACPTLEKVIVKEGELNEIEYCTFSWCESLKSVELPDNVKVIGKEAFHTCPNLESITMNGVERIEGAAFCESGLTSVHLPNSLKFIGEAAFASCNLESITIPDSVDTENIGECIFLGCKKLKKTILPDRWEEIKGSMFCNCESLEDINLPSTLKIIREAAFEGCSRLKEIVIPDGVTEIKQGAFYNCEKLSKVTIPNSVKTIEYIAFCDCKSLSEVTIPNSVKTIGHSAFHNVESLKLATIPYGALLSECDGHFLNCFSGYSDLKVIINDDITEIPEEAFTYDTGIVSVSIPKGVKRIGKSAFTSYRREKLIDLQFPDTVTVLENNALEHAVFAGKLPSKLEYIGNYALADYYGESITIPGSVKFFGYNAFYNSNLKSVVIEPGVTEIPSAAFSAWNGYYRSPGALEKIEIPNTVTKIGASAFFDQPNLTDVKIPDSVKIIEIGAFQRCENLNTQVTGEWYRVNKDDETDIVDPADPNGKNLYWYSNCNWYRK